MREAPQIQALSQSTAGPTRGRVGRFFSVGDDATSRSPLCVFRVFCGLSLSFSLRPLRTLRNPRVPFHLPEVHPSTSHCVPRLPPLTSTHETTATAPRCPVVNRISAHSLDFCRAGATDL